MSKEFSRRRFLRDALNGVIAASAIVIPHIPYSPWQDPDMVANRNPRAQDREPYHMEYGPFCLTIEGGTDTLLRQKLDSATAQLYGLLSTFTPFIENANSLVNIIGYRTDNFVKANFSPYTMYTRARGSDYFSKTAYVLEGSNLSVNLEAEYLQSNFHNVNVINEYLGTWGLGMTGFLHEAGHASLGALDEAWGYWNTPYPNWFAEGTAMCIAFSCANSSSSRYFAEPPSNISELSLLPLATLEGSDTVNGAVSNHGIDVYTESFVAVSTIIRQTGDLSVRPILQMVADMKNGRSFDATLYTQTGLTRADFYKHMEDTVFAPQPPNLIIPSTPV